ncbi:hypothetical protein GTA08_BOTSDO13722 [Botryosphaeria dothidea]|uniref:Uncharacterized protein n=1 Tax=Botryosphaeria dothidea TaxID=55169 RepID=A0A8H4J0V0_9PEZI|nr:hypothetical protein GTA08_BOTSDO13722 [Botryosphaeria dothidea]
MKFSISAITVSAIGLLLSSAAASPVAAASQLEARDCVANAAIIDEWHEDGLQRYRVAFSTTKSDVALGESCGLFYDGISKCGAVNNNIACYHSSAADSWVIDNNQLSSGNTAIEDCLVSKFRDAFANKIGCRV